MGVRTVEWGEHVENVIGYAVATPGSNRVHLVADEPDHRWGLAICGQRVHMDHRSEFVSGRTRANKALGEIVSGVDGKEREYAWYSEHGYWLGASTGAWHPDLASLLAHHRERVAA